MLALACVRKKRWWLDLSLFFRISDKNLFRFCTWNISAESSQFTCPCQSLRIAKIRACLSLLYYFLLSVGYSNEDDDFWIYSFWFELLDNATTSHTPAMYLQITSKVVVPLSEMFRWSSPLTDSWLLSLSVKGFLHLLSHAFLLPIIINLSHYVRNFWIGPAKTSGKPISHLFLRVLAGDWRSKHIHSNLGQFPNFGENLQLLWKDNESTWLILSSSMRILMLSPGTHLLLPRVCTSDCSH